MDDIDVILEYRRLAKSSPVHRPRVGNAKDLKIAAAFLTWCEKQLIDPKAALEARFRRIKFTPRFNSLCSERVLRDARLIEVTQNAMKGHVAMDVQYVRDLSRMLPGQEDTRRHYYGEGRPELCRYNSLAGGYDPRSVYCPICPERGDCARELNQAEGYDVVALRLGRFEGLPGIVRSAMQGWDGRVSV